jgi:hypothetical protein
VPETPPDEDDGVPLPYGPDLIVRSITFSADPVEKVTVEVTATIENIGDTNVGGDIDVKFSYRSRKETASFSLPEELRVSF